MPTFPKRGGNPLKQIDLVVKIGSMAMIQPGDGTIDYNIFQRLGDDLRPGMALVTSGATEIGRLDYLHRAGLGAQRRSRAGQDRLRLAGADCADGQLPQVHPPRLRRAPAIGGAYAFQRSPEARAYLALPAARRRAELHSHHQL